MVERMKMKRRKFLLSATGALLALPGAGAFGAPVGRFFSLYFLMP